MKLLGPGATCRATPTASAPGRAAWQIVPQQKRLAQLMVTIQNVTWNRRNVMPHLTKCASVIKKNAATCRCENHLRAGSAHQNAEAQRAQLQAGQPCPLCGSTSIQRSRRIRRWNRVLIRPGYYAGKRSEKARRRRCGAARATDALTKQLQRDENEAQSLRQESKHLLNNGKPSRPASISPCTTGRYSTVAGCTR